MDTGNSVREALFEVRFAAPALGEIVIGRLASNPEWAHLVPQRLPVADIPLPIRAMDQNLKFQATLQLNNRSGTMAVKLGEHSASLHMLNSYPGWQEFESLLNAFSTYLCNSFSDLRVERMGLRYINGLSQPHGFDDITSLNVSILVGGVAARFPMNINYKRNQSPDIALMVRMASPDFITGLDPQDRFLVDIDAFTPDRPAESNPEYIADWAQRAHTALKNEFLTVIPTSYRKRIESISSEVGHASN